MAKVILIFLIFVSFLKANSLEKDCLECHKREKIPSSIIYKRYLLNFSTKNRIKKTMFNYLKTPNKDNSILPKQFFIKFKIKQPSSLNNKELNKSIDEFIEKYDLAKKLFLPKK